MSDTTTLEGTAVPARILRPVLEDACSPLPLL